MAALDELVSLNPNAQWWIKGSGTDIVKGLCQSVSGQWSGNWIMASVYGVLLED